MPKITFADVFDSVSIEVVTALPPRVIHPGFLIRAITTLVGGGQLRLSYQLGGLYATAADALEDCPRYCVVVPARYYEAGQLLATIEKVWVGCSEPLNTRENKIEKSLQCRAFYQNERNTL